PPVRPGDRSDHGETLLLGDHDSRLDRGTHRGLRYPEIWPAGRAESLIVTSIQLVERSNSCRVRFTSRFPPTIRSGPSVFTRVSSVGLSRSGKGRCPTGWC